MNKQGLYWPDGRTLFRRGPRPAVRSAWWAVLAAAVVLVAGLSL